MVTCDDGPGWVGFGIVPWNAVSTCAAVSRCLRIPGVRCTPWSVSRACLLASAAMEVLPLDLHGIPSDLRVHWSERARLVKGGQSTHLLRVHFRCLSAAVCMSRQIECSTFDGNHASCIPSLFQRLQGVLPIVLVYKIGSRGSA